LVTDAYPPEIRSASHLMQELAEELNARGHTITVGTCYPRYNLVKDFSPFNFKEYSVENGIRVIRIRTLPHHKVNFLIRGISQITLPHIFQSKLRTYLKDGVDVVTVYSPPLPLWQVGFWAKKRFGAKFVLNVQDIFPQNAIDLGVLRNPLLIWLFEKMENSAYRKADVVTVHSRGNRDFLIEKKLVSPEKVKILYNWVDIKDCEDVGGFSGFRKRLGLDGKFLFFFGGVIGPSQGLDLVIDAAKELTEIKEIVILLVGDGTEKAKLERKVKHYGLKNVIFHPFIPKDDYQLALKEIDVGLVCLTMKNRTPVVPGKMLHYMAAGVPVLAFLNKESDGHNIIKESGCGYSELSDNPQKAAVLMMKMYHEKENLKMMGEKGVEFAKRHFSRKACVDNLEKLLR